MTTRNGLLVVGLHSRNMYWQKQLGLNRLETSFASTPERVRGVNIDAFLYTGGDADLLAAATRQMHSSMQCGWKQYSPTADELIDWLWDDERELASTTNERLWKTLALERMGIQPAWKEQQSAGRRKVIEAAIALLDNQQHPPPFGQLRALLGTAP